MKIKFYDYNAFLIESGDKRIAIDPGGVFFYWFRLTTLIPTFEWKNITHILITHGNPDHYWHADRVASASNASVICNKTMVRNIHGKVLMLGPRDKGLAFTTEFAKVHTLSVNETIEIDSMSITGIKTTHGELVFKLGSFSKILKPGPDERIGWGAIGFKISLDGKIIVNFGDTLLHEKAWQAIFEPDVLMIPIGGKTIHNMMNVEEAIQAVKSMRPKLVIPCHYNCNCPAFFTKTYNPADDELFKREAEKEGSKCAILGAGDSIDFADE